MVSNPFENPVEAEVPETAALEAELAESAEQKEAVAARWWAEQWNADKARITDLIKEGFE